MVRKSHLVWYSVPFSQLSSRLYNFLYSHLMGHFWGAVSCPTQIYQFYIGINNNFFHNFRFHVLQSSGEDSQSFTSWLKHIKLNAVNKLFVLISGIMVAWKCQIVKTWSFLEEYGQWKYSVFLVSSTKWIQHFPKYVPHFTELVQISKICLVNNFSP